MNNMEKQYLALLQDIIDNGTKKSDRTGTGTLSVFGRQIRHKMSDGFPAMTTKKMAFKTMVTELLWFLRSDTNIKFLVDNDCHIWDGDAYQAYLKKRTTANKDNVREPHTLANGMTGQISRAFTKEEFINKIKTDDEFAKKWGELGPIYGKQWREWKRSTTRDEKIVEPGVYTKQIDQIANLINDLKNNPDSRRLMVNAWNVGEIGQMVLPPCHYGFQVYTRELSLEERIKQIPYSEKHTIFEEKECIDELRTLNGEELQSFQKYIKEQCDKINIPTRAISLMFNMRSCDVPLGLPFNIASYALLLEIIGRIVNMATDELVANLCDTHIYLNQVDGIKEQLTRQPYGLPRLGIDGSVNFTGGIDDFLGSCDKNSFSLVGYKSHPAIKIPLSN